jgi:hypothetical protein
MIVIYKDNIYNYKELVLNNKYIVSKINNDNLYLIGYSKKYSKTVFVKEDETNIDENTYNNKLILNRRNIEAGDKVLCVDNYGDNRLIIGEVYIIEDFESFTKSQNIDLKIKVELPHKHYYGYYTYSNYLNSNMFIKYDNNIKRFLKMQKIINNISII